MTPEFYLIIGFLSCGLIVGIGFLIVYLGKRYLQSELEGFRLRTKHEIALENDHQFLVWRNDLKLEFAEKIENFQPKIQALEVKPKEDKPFWDDRKQLKETLAGLGQTELDVPNIPQLQNLSVNEAYHVIQDRIEELEG